jgi:hypothetical protein
MPGSMMSPSAHRSDFLSFHKMISRRIEKAPLSGALPHGNAGLCAGLLLSTNGWRLRMTISW